MQTLFIAAISIACSSAPAADVVQKVETNKSETTKSDVKQVETKQDASKTDKSADKDAPPAGRLGGLFRNPITQARESARRNTSMNNLKQLALAMHNHADAHKRFPPAATTDKQAKPLLSWRVQMLPYIEESDLYQQFKQDEPWDSDHNKKLIEKMPKLFENPADVPLEAGKTSYVVVRGKETVFHDNKGATFAQMRDGTSNTILIVEAGPKSVVIWTKPDDIEFDEKDPMAGLLGMREGGFLSAFADGSVRFLKDTTGKEQLKALLTRAGGEKIEQ